MNRLFPNTVNTFRRISLSTNILDTNWSRTKGELTLSKDAYYLHRLEESPQLTSILTKEEALKIYKQMQTIRRMEGLASTLYHAKKIRGFCHIYSGEEACACGLKSIMTPKDTVITSYRCHGWASLMGQSPESIFGELLGKLNGSSRGKGGSMHMYGPNFYGGNGIVGSHVPIGTGIGLMHKYTNSGGASFTIFGDGAADQGQTFESYNMAKLWNLPVIYIIENNLYSMGTAVNRHSANPEYYRRGDLIPGIKLDGMDILAVREAGRFARDHVTSGKGPIILQLDTYRFSGHSLSDPGTSYRTKDEVKQARESRDCIKSFVAKILKTNLITNDEVKQIDKEVKKEIETATANCFKAKEPGVEEVCVDIYKEYPSTVKMPGIFSFQKHINVSPLAKKI